MSKANDRQVGGDHYRKKDGVQHWDYAIDKKFDMFQYVITKYIERWRDKQGIADLEKASHYLEKYIETVKSGIEVPTFNGKLDIIRKELPPKIEQGNPRGYKEYCDTSTGK